MADFLDMNSRQGNSPRAQAVHEEDQCLGYTQSLEHQYLKVKA
ncbi:hypothetical protein HMPREF9069_00342 [Atopobium sp. oral taxon 810 str. F0209]|nr:hypothetical protein HMPREF9069_00342 [Atopobium sp. oral taxon 810 str. F0209]